MSRPAQPSHVDENAYFGEVEDDHKDETVAKCVEVSNEENGEGAARPASPATKIRKHVEPDSPATLLRQRLGTIICWQNHLKRIGNFDLASNRYGPIVDDDLPRAKSPQLHLSTELEWQSIVADTKAAVEKFLQDTTRTKDVGLQKIC